MLGARIGAFGGHAVTQGHGLYIAPSADNGILGGNDFRGNALGGLYCPNPAALKATYPGLS